MKTGLYLGEVPIGKVVVAVASENGIKLQEKTVIPSKGDPIEVTPDIGTDGLSKVTVEPIPDAYIDTTTNNAPYAEDMLKGTIAFANTNKIEGTLEDKNVLEYSANRLSFENGDLIVSGTNTERAIVKAEADVSIAVGGADLGNATAADVLNGKTFTSENGLVIEGTGPTLANLDAIDSNVLASKKFIGSNGIEETGTIVTKTSNDLTASGATVTVPAGYYASQATKSVATAIQATPSISISSSGLITASATQSAGYVSSGTKSATKQLTTKQATTYTPSTSNQILSAGTYCTGAQTIKGDSNLVASNIKSGVSIFGVSGSYSGGDIIKSGWKPNSGSIGSSVSSTISVPCNNISQPHLVILCVRNVDSAGASTPFFWKFDLTDNTGILINSDGSLDISVNYTWSLSGGYIQINTTDYVYFDDGYYWYFLVSGQA